MTNSTARSTTYAADSASGVMRPDRDHWPSANSIVFSGGGIAEGQVQHAHF
jgi:hypothetical protein